MNIVRREDHVLNSKIVSHAGGMKLLELNGGGMAFDIDLLVEKHLGTKRAMVAIGFEDGVINRHRLTGMLELLHRADRRGHELVGVVYTYKRPEENRPVMLPDDVEQIAVIRESRVRTIDLSAASIFTAVARQTMGRGFGVRVAEGAHIGRDGEGLDYVIDISRIDETLPQAPQADDLRAVTKWQNLNKGQGCDVDLISLDPGLETGVIYELKLGGGTFEGLDKPERWALGGLGKIVDLPVRVVDHDWLGC